MNAILRKILAALVTAALLAGLPASSFAGVTAGPDCDPGAAWAPVDSGAAEDKCCQDGGAAPEAGGGCTTHCAMVLTVMGCSSPKALPEFPGAAPAVRPERSLRALSAPPDTAPPKRALI